jgi:hypothetical protein
MFDARTTLLASPWLAPMLPEVGARTLDVLKDHGPADKQRLVQTPR